MVKNLPSRPHSSNKMNHQRHQNSVQTVDNLVKIKANRKRDHSKVVDLGNRAFAPDSVN